ncbi:hypothetical protein CEP53_004796 [Fusarium sp. AF-6]|nr:hypothetical protein CEP53_004796 [Fusarium sp. AF-6]
MSSKKSSDSELAPLTVFRYQYSSLPITLSSADCAGKVFVITGANSGLGFECVKHLVTLGCKKVIMAVRSRQRGLDALALVESETVKRFATKVEEELERVDGLINNAAAADGSWNIVQGMESSIAVNLVGTILLTVLIMPYLRKCVKQFNCTPRVSFLTSGLAWGRKSDLAKIDKNRGILNDVNDSEKWSMGGVNRQVS